MSRKILQRCDVCGRFHAAYLVPAEEGLPRYYCYSCWKSRFDISTPQTKDKENLLPNLIDNQKKPS